MITNIHRLKYCRNEFLRPPWVLRERRGLARAYSSSSTYDNERSRQELALMVIDFTSLTLPPGRLCLSQSVHLNHLSTYLSWMIHGAD
jgi:hypothetical protein